MSSDDELYAQDARRRSLASPVPPSAGGYGVPDSPRFDNAGGEADRRTSVNENGGGSTANEIANSDERVREILYSDVCIPMCRFLMVDWIKCAVESIKAGCCHLQGTLRFTLRN
jgi:hypothetical protein